MSQLLSREIRGLKAAAAGSVICAVTATLLLIPLLQSSRIPESPVFSDALDIPLPVVTGQACRNCHADVHDAHAAAPHGRTLMRMKTPDDRQILSGRQWRRPDTGVEYEYEVSGQQLLLRSSATIGSRPVTWLVGSGRHARTPLLTWIDADGRTAAIEHSVSLYPDGDLGTTLEMEVVKESLGLPALGNYRSCSETANCFGCHSTIVPVHDGQVLEDQITPGVGCIRCHQDAEKHALAMERGEEFIGERLTLLSPREAVDRCGECHRRADELGGQLHPENPTLVRFASVGLVQSLCFRKQPHGADTPGNADDAHAAGRLDCTTCHSPHAETDARWQTHTAVCLRCHHMASEKNTFDCPQASPSDNCLECHMKKVSFGERLKFTDHWIR